MFNKSAAWFSRVVWLGIIFNLLFVAEQIFAPDMVNVGMGVPVTGTTVWNVAHGAMVLALSLLYIPAAIDPLKYPLYSWMIVLSRLIAAVLWAFVATSQPGFIGALVMDGSFGVAEGILLQFALPVDKRMSAGHLARFFARIWAWTRTEFAYPAVRIGAAVVVAVVAIVAYLLWYNLVRAEPDIQYSAVQDHFK
ncbi:MAG: hypothetical protein JO051_01635, partial [Acidobacteriaceae bacterium]|nr:hypothetical protein [Acidobacteriaceae bacterium]